MKAMIKSAVLAFLGLTLILGVVYPLVVYGLGQLFFYKEANGSLIRSEGRIVGSSLIGQNFKGERYFHPRPSAAEYNAAASSGSNLGPTSQKLISQVKMRAEQFKKENGLLETQEIPASAVTSSGSGLDPHITTVHARLQAGRVGKARGLSEEQVLQMIAEHEVHRVLSEEGFINVLELNLVMDQR